VDGNVAVRLTLGAGPTPERDPGIGGAPRVRGIPVRGSNASTRTACRIAFTKGSRFGTPDALDGVERFVRGAGASGDPAHGEIEMPGSNERRHHFASRTAIAIASALLLASCGADPAEDGSELGAVHDAVPEAAAAKAKVDGGAGSAGRKTKGPAPIEQPPAATGPAATLAFALTAAATDPVAELVIADTPKVLVVADWTGVSSDLGERLDLFEPSGLLYYSSVISFSEAQRSDATVTRDADGSYRVAFTLQIQGSPIEMYAIQGAWRATVSLAGTRAEPVASATVTLR
jgi:hypothetical protein